MSVNNRILISGPVYGKVDLEIAEDWMRFAYYCGRRMPQYEFFLGLKNKSEQFRARNMIVEAAQQYNCDRILMMDDDMLIDAFQQGRDAYAFLEKLLSHDKDICGVLYYQRGAEGNPVLMTKLSEKGYRFLRDDEIEHGLQRVDVAGGGCLLIKTRVFDRISFPYFAPEYEYGTDIQLCRKATEKGFEVWADTSIELGHLRDEKTVITHKNRKQFQHEAVGESKVTFVESDVYNRVIADAVEYTGKDFDSICHDADRFLKARKESTLSDAEWYRLYPTERVCRQVWFNTQNSIKQLMTRYIIGGIAHHRPLKILDFGCGIGITAFTLAEKGHKVTAMDIRGTGTYEFLKWRAKKHGVDIRFWESEGGVPALCGEEFDVIIAMDSIEHIKEWEWAVEELGKHLKSGGMLFSNNGILDDLTQPEHYPVHNDQFIAACMKSNMYPFTQISYVKREVKAAPKEEYAEVTNS